MSNVSFIKRTIDNGDYSKLSDSDNISANFYDALSGLNLDQDNTNLEFIAQWSPAVKRIVRTVIGSCFPAVTMSRFLLPHRNYEKVYQPKLRY